MQVDINPDDARECKADSKGRINLGVDKAGKTVDVVVLEVRESDD